MKKIWKKLLPDAVAAGTLAGVVVWWISWQHSLAYHDGTRNSGAWLGAGVMTMLWVAMAVLVVLIFAMARLTSLAKRDGWAVLMVRLGTYAVLLTVPWLFLAYHHFPPDSGFRGGLCQWAHAHVDAPAIRTWMASLTSADVQNWMPKNKVTPMFIKRLKAEMVLVHRDRCSIWFGGGFMHWGFTIEKSSAVEAPYTGRMGPPRRFAPGSYAWCH